MADIKKARAAFMELIEDLDPSVKCTIPAKAAQGNYLIELARGEEKQALKVSEKDFLAFDDDEDLRQKLEEKVMNAIDKLPDSDKEADVEDEDVDDEALEEEVEEEDAEEGEDDFDEEEEEEEEEEEV